MFQRLGLQIIVPVVLVTILAAGVSAFLNYGKFARTLAEVESARFTLIAKRIRTAIEANLNLGLTLPGLVIAQPLIEREHAIIPDALAVMVFDTRGSFLFGSGRNRLPQLDKAPALWLEQRRQGEWTAETPAWRMVGTTLANPFGDIVGGVAVLYPRGTGDQILAGMARRLITAGGVIAGATALLALLVASLLLHRVQRTITTVTRELAPGAPAHSAAVLPVKARVEEAHVALDAVAAGLAPEAGAAPSPLQGATGAGGEGDRL